MKVVRVPMGLRSHFSHNQLSGWPNGISYTPAPLEGEEGCAPARRRQKKEAPSTPPLSARPVTVGTSLLSQE